jgi:NADH-quinone oxidoreductase subunit E
MMITCTWQSRVDDLIGQRGANRAALLPCLVAVQAEAGYVPREAISHLGQTLGVPTIEVYGVISFYGMLTSVEQGSRVIRICDSLNCHLNHAPDVRRAVETELGLKDGETLPDKSFSLEVVPCLGLCDLAPAMMVNEDTYGNLTEARVRDIIADLKRQEASWKK